MQKLLLILSFMMLSPTSLANSHHNFVSINYLIEQEIGRIVLPEIYEQLGMYISITPLPGKRAQYEATTGLKDGEIMRIFSYGEENPTTLRVPTPYYYLETMAFVHIDSNIEINSKDELANYKIAKVRGVKHTNNITHGLKNVTDHDTTRQIMRLVESGFVDVALTNRIDGLMVIKEMGLKNVIPTTKPLARLDLFHYIHNKKKYLIPAINHKIKEMKRTGELSELVTKAESMILKQSVQDHRAMMLGI